MNILVTGFEPFGGETFNPAWEAVQLLPDSLMHATVVKQRIPVEFGEAPKRVWESVKSCNPHAVVSIGQAGGRACISIERIGVNLMDARIPDNAGYQPVDEPIVSGGADGLFSTLPIREMMEEIKKSGIPAEISYSAGTYVCNNVLYEVLYQAEKNRPSLKAGFIHVPFDPRQVVGKVPSTPSMTVASIAQGLTQALIALVQSLNA